MSMPFTKFKTIHHGTETQSKHREKHEGLSIPYSLWLTRFRLDKQLASLNVNP